MQPSTFVSGARLYNAAGERFMEAYDPVRKEASTRDVSARAIFDQIRFGKAVDGGVVLDVSAVPDEVFRHENSKVVERLDPHGIDYRTIPLIIAPEAHFVMGGVLIDEWGGSSRPGLYACGETAGGVHGGNRLNSNAVPETQVFGHRAGQAAARHARAAVHGRWTTEASGGGRGRLAAIRDESAEVSPELKAALVAFRDAMWLGLGIVRTEAGLSKAAAQAEAIEEATAARGPRRWASWWPRPSSSHLAAAARASTASAFFRTESRAAHYREDHPDDRSRLGRDRRLRGWAGVAVPPRRRPRRGRRARPAGRPDSRGRRVRRVRALSPRAEVVPAFLGPTVHETDLLARTAAAEAARDRTRRAGIAVGRALVLVVFLGAWGFASGRLVDAEFLSDPRGVAAAFIALVTSGRLFPHLGQTLIEVLGGYAIGVVLGVALTVLVAAVEAAHRVLRPFLIAFYSIPKIALAPLIVMWFGLATAPKIILAAAFVFFVVFMNMVAGVYTVNPQQANALRVMGAGRFELLTKLILPGTVPYLMTGLRLAVPEALIGAVVGEFISANRGLGIPGHLRRRAVQHRRNDGRHPGAAPDRGRHGPGPEPRRAASPPVASPPSSVDREGVRHRRPAGRGVPGRSSSGPEGCSGPTQRRVSR